LPVAERQVGGPVLQGGQYPVAAPSGSDTVTLLSWDAAGETRIQAVLLVDSSRGPGFANQVQTLAWPFGLAKPTPAP
jgi:hypothetical protein